MKEIYAMLASIVLFLILANRCEMITRHIKLKIGIKLDYFQSLIVHEFTSNFNSEFCLLLKKV